jgi:hypothetical protein
VVSATGTWDVISSGGRAGQGTATLTVDGSSFVFASTESTLSFTVNGDSMTLAWSDRTDGVLPLLVTHASSPVDTGIVPLALGGQWTFASTKGVEQCTASLAANGLNATCSPFTAPFGRVGGALAGIRQQTKSSIFGALGGVWHFTGASSGTLDATLSGSVFTTVVRGNTGITGSDAWLTVKLCNGTASGKASSGLELAATRR